MNTQTTPANDPVFHPAITAGYPSDSHAAAIFGDAQQEAIVILGSFVAQDSRGIFWRVNNATIEKTSYIADLYVNLDRAGALAVHLSDDVQFVSNVMSHLREAGYTGAEFDRAELGMQGDRVVVLEPNKDFTAFAQSKGFILKD